MTTKHTKLPSMQIVNMHACSSLVVPPITMYVQAVKALNAQACLNLPW